MCRWIAYRGETTPLEPSLLEHKYYAKGVGLVLTVDVKTGEREELVKIERDRSSAHLAGQDSFDFGALRASKPASSHFAAGSARSADHHHAQGGVADSNGVTHHDGDMDGHTHDHALGSHVLTSGLFDL